MSLFDLLLVTPREASQLAGENGAESGAAEVPFEDTLASFFQGEGDRPQGEADPRLLLDPGILLEDGDTGSNAPSPEATLELLPLELFAETHTADAPTVLATLLTAREFEFQAQTREMHRDQGAPAPRLDAEPVRVHTPRQPVLDAARTDAVPHTTPLARSTAPLPTNPEPPDPAGPPARLPIDVESGRDSAEPRPLPDAIQRPEVPRQAPPPELRSLQLARDTRSSGKLTEQAERNPTPTVAAAQRDGTLGGSQQAASALLERPSPIDHGNVQRPTIRREVTARSVDIERATSFDRGVRTEISGGPERDSGERSFDEGPRSGFSADLASSARLSGSPNAALASFEAALTQVATTRSEGTVATSAFPPAAGTPQEAIPLHVEWLAARGGGTARIRLHPPELGAVDLSVRVRGNSVEVSILASEPAAQLLVREGREQLSEALANRDLRMDQFEVSGGSRDARDEDGPAFRDPRDPRDSDGNRREFRPDGFGKHPQQPANSASGEPRAPDATNMTPFRGASGVDLRV